ncbi:MAG: PilZ domain-containing protein [Thermodesulfobacteriota bacterium]|nr:PilZ domain-containing protein [Thermodesulfobacteriota bacterium]
MNRKETKLKHQKERRLYYRIDDEVILLYREIPPDELKKIKTNLSEQLVNAFTLDSKFAAIGQEIHLLLIDIKKQSRAMARYLSTIDRKLNILARAVLAQERDVLDQPAQLVNLGAGGLAFYAITPAELNGVLELRMILNPSCTGILTYGKVVYCNDNSGDVDGFPYRIGVEFCEIENETRDLLVKHILHKEVIQKKEVKYPGTWK